MFFSVPIEYFKKEKNLLLVDKASEAKLLVEGSVAALQSLDPSQIRIKVDLSAMSAGRHLIQLSDENISIPKRFKVIDIDPGYFNVEMKQVVIQHLKIEPQIVGTLPNGFGLSNVEISPATVAVLGFPGEIGQARITTSPIYLSGLKESTTMYCKVIGAVGLQFSDKKISDVAVRLTIEKSQ